MQPTAGFGALLPLDATVTNGKICPEAVAAPGHAPGTKGETYIRHHLPELDTKPLLEVRGLKMHFPVTDPHADYEAETRRRNRLAFGRGYRRDVTQAR